MSWNEDDHCRGCDLLERQLDHECKHFERQLEALQQENAELKDQLAELRWMMEGLEK